MIKLPTLHDEKPGVVVAATSVAAALVAAAACVGPLAGIALGVTGLGSLASLAFLSVPAGIASLVLVAVAVVLFARRKASCVSRRTHRRFKGIVAGAAALVVALNAVEFAVLPALA